MSVSDSESVMIISSLLVFKLKYLRFGDSSGRLLKDDDVFMNLVDTKCCGVPKRAKVVIVFASVPNNDIFQLKSLPVRLLLLS